MPSPGATPIVASVGGFALAAAESDIRKVPAALYN